MLFSRLDKPVLSSRLYGRNYESLHIQKGHGDLEPWSRRPLTLGDHGEREVNVSKLILKACDVAVPEGLFS